MKKYKVCVYAICKNEEKFVKRWINSMKEADEIYVLDTGSDDNSVNLLKENGVHVKTKEISPWRFDVARNESLKMVPDDIDICVCTDLDEIFEKGWRESLEKIWEKSTDRIAYAYNWKLDENNNPQISFYIEKIHSRNNYSWINPVHEILKWNIERPENKIKTDKIILNHYPDPTKSRSSYLPLLELSIKEDPTNDRNMHYLGREYMYYKEWEKCITTLKKHISMPNALWKDERCASMRFIARSYKNLNKLNEARFWYKEAIKEAPYLRDPYIELAILEYEQKNWDEVYEQCINASKITSHAKTYINEEFSWNNTIYDLLSISSFYKGNLQESLEWLDKAINMAPNDERLLNNKVIISNALKDK